MAIPSKSKFIPKKLTLQFLLSGPISWPYTGNFAPGECFRMRLALLGSSSVKTATPISKEHL